MVVDLLDQTILVVVEEELLKQVKLELLLDHLLLVV
jgi:hypothetical protein|tara:strand:- start:266 stop:373 length:108 start_codon:yes stop_codon:yes gene_type:complete